VLSILRNGAKEVADTLTEPPVTEYRAPFLTARASGIRVAAEAAGDAENKSVAVISATAGRLVEVKGDVAGENGAGEQGIARAIGGRRGIAVTPSSGTGLKCPGRRGCRCRFETRVWKGAVFVEMLHLPPVGRAVPDCRKQNHRRNRAHRVDV